MLGSCLDHSLITACPLRDIEVKQPQDQICKVLGVLLAGFHFFYLAEGMIGFFFLNKRKKKLKEKQIFYTGSLPK